MSMLLHDRNPRSPSRRYPAPESAWLLAGKGLVVVDG